MKRKIIVIVILLCLAAALVPPAVTAAGGIYFTAIDYTLLPLNAETMPAYYGSALYIPYTFFSSDALGVYFAAAGDRVYLYSTTSKNLTFDVARATVFDQDGTQYYFPAQRINGLIYVPVDRVCQFFGLAYEFIPSNDPAPVIRFNSGPFSINKETFIGMNKSRMQAYYKAYTAVTPPAVSPGIPGASSQPLPSPSTPPTFEDISLYLSFCNLSSANFGAVLDALDTYRYKGCFFVSADEIAANADLIRRAAGAGHTVGIWLKEGTFGEYQQSASLLFEASKLRTILISADGTAAKTAETTAAAKGLVCWKPSRSYDTSAKITLAGVTDGLSIIHGSRESLNFACTDNSTALIRSFFSFLAEKKYSVRRLTERTLPTYTIG